MARNTSTEIPADLDTTVLYDFQLLIWIAIAFIGSYIHQLFEFSSDFGLIPEYIVPMAIMLTILIIFALWKPGSRASYWVAGVFALLNLFGTLTVFPLGVLPFVPDQSTEHYIAHILYALFQFPLLIYCISKLRYLSRASSR